jgi:hypothetical protein
MKTLHITGKLKASNPDEVNDISHHNVWRAMSFKHSLFVLKDFNVLWKFGELEFSRQRTVEDGETAANEFIEKLAAVLVEEGIPELGLRGEIILVISDNEHIEGTIIHRLLVEDEQVLHSKADFNWENYTVTNVTAKQGAQ